MFRKRNINFIRLRRKIGMPLLLVLFVCFFCLILLAGLFLVQFFHRSNDRRAGLELAEEDFQLGKSGFDINMDVLRIDDVEWHGGSAVQKKAYLGGQSVTVINAQNPCVSLENNRENAGLVLQYDVYLEDTDELIYSSKYIPCGKSESWDAYSSGKLQAGENKVSYAVVIYDEVGNIAAKVNIGGATLFLSDAAGDNLAEDWYEVTIPVLHVLSIEKEDNPVSGKDLTVEYEIWGKVAADKTITVCPGQEITLWRKGSEEEEVIGLTGYMEDELLTSFQPINVQESAYSHGMVLRELSVGQWYGYVTMDVDIIDFGKMLTDKQIFAYVQPDRYATELVIPRTVTMDGRTYPVRGIYTNTLGEYPNLKKVTIEGGRKYFQFYKEMSVARDLTIDCGNTNVYFYNTGFKGAIKLEHAGILGAEQFYSKHGSHYLEDIGQFKYYEQFTPEAVDNDTLVIPEGICSSDGTKYVLGGNYRANAKKMVVPQLKYVRDICVYSDAALEELYMDSTVVGMNAFSWCTALRKVTFGPNCQVIMTEAFEHCENLSEVVFEGEPKFIDSTAFIGTAYLDSLKAAQSEVYINGFFMGYGDSYVPESEEYAISEYQQSESPNVVNLECVPEGTKTLKFDERLYGTSPAFYGMADTVETLDLNGMRCSISNLDYSKFPSLKKIITGLDVFRPYDRSAITAYEIVLGDRTETISDFAFDHYTRYEGETFTIPASVTQIGNELNTVSGGTGMTNHAFYDFGQNGVFREFKVEEREDGKVYFRAVDGILYTGDMKTLVAVPRAKTFQGGVYELPEGIVYLGELSFSRNVNFTELVIDDALKIYTDVSELNTAASMYVYDGYFALNKGNSLSTALYAYTDVQRYTVKESNPDYKSVDGIIYSKDGKHLIAIPHHYQGVIKVAEGCEYWDENALWLDYGDIGGVNEGITGIVLPDSLVSIEDRQLGWINAHMGHAVTIGEGNPYFTRYDFLNGWNIVKIEYPTDFSEEYILTDQIKVIEHNEYWIDSANNRIGGAGYNEVKAVSLAPFILPEGSYEVSIYESEKTRNGNIGTETTGDGNIRNANTDIQTTGDGITRNANVEHENISDTESVDGQTSLRVGDHLSGWYITVKRSKLNGEAAVASDVSERDVHYVTGDTFTVAEPDTAIHIDIRAEDVSMMDGTLPRGLSVSIRRL